MKSKAFSSFSRRFQLQKAVSIFFEIFVPCENVLTKLLKDKIKRNKMKNSLGFICKHVSTLSNGIWKGTIFRQIAKAFYLEATNLLGTVFTRFQVKVNNQTQLHMKQTNHVTKLLTPGHLISEWSLKNNFSFIKHVFNHGLKRGPVWKFSKRTFFFYQLRPISQHDVMYYR